MMDLSQNFIWFFQDLYISNHENNLQPIWNLDMLNEKKNDFNVHILMHLETIFVRNHCYLKIDMIFHYKFNDKKKNTKKNKLK
jgi:hypothetical protein